MRQTFKRFLFCLCLAWGPATAQVTEATLTAEGAGMTRDEAVAAALANAAGQAFGIRLEANSVSTTLAAEAVTNDQSDTAMVSAMNRVVTQAIRSPVNSPILGYSIDHLSEGIADTWDATVTLRYAQFQSIGADSDRRTVIVVTSDARHADLLVDTVSESLIASRRFDVLNRRNEQLFEAEKAFILGNDAATAEVARLQQAGGADYLVIAELQGLSIRNNMRETIRMTGEVLVKSAVSGALRLQVVEFASRKVKWSATQKFGASYEGVSAIGSATLTRLITDASGKLMDNLVSSIYPIRVVKVVGDTVIINRGEGSASVGERYAVFLMGEELTDPQSDESLGALEIEVGIGQITDVKPKFSFMKMGGATLDPQGEYIVRKTDRKASAASSGPKASGDRPAAPARRAAPTPTPQAPSRADVFLN